MSIAEVDVVVREVRENIRNIAIIAHVDHGKTTLVDVILRQSGTFRHNQVVTERVMDSNALEREKGITILSKVTAVYYDGVKINIFDTPGHSDFGGEVERILRSVDGVLLLVDAREGPMPQTRFVLKKALEQRLKPIVVINKIDRQGSRPWEVIDEVLDLFIELGCSEDLLDFPYIFTSATEGYAVLDPSQQGKDIDLLFKMILEHIPPPTVQADSPFQLQVTNLDYDDHLGRMFGGKILCGTVRRGETVAIIKRDGTQDKFAVTKVFIYQGLKRIEVEEASAGEIVLLAGYEDVQIGSTIADADQPKALPLIHIDEPTVSMDFIVNNSPWAGKSGKWITMRNLSNRLYKEAKVNVSLRVEPTDSPDSLRVSGRGELQLAILLETMRREGYEVAVSKPKAITRKIDGVLCEPIEEVTIDVNDEAVGTIIQELAARKGEIISMSKDETGNNRLIFEVPTRGLIGFRSDFLTWTKGLGMISRMFKEYGPHRGEIVTRTRGSLIVKETGRATAYAIAPLQERATFFISPGDEVYEGQVVGENSRSEDMVVNVTKAKHATNMRSSTEEATVLITPPRQFMLEQALAFIGDDELLEVTPDALRFRKRILNQIDRRLEERRSR
ncbi:MAG TPA: translational GTPase TypA [Armatimonadota bacterium]|nr:translational GTPase TypA [Armatimonadota bacterium]